MLRWSLEQMIAWDSREVVSELFLSRPPSRLGAMGTGGVLWQSAANKNYTNKNYTNKVNLTQLLPPQFAHCTAPTFVECTGVICVLKSICVSMSKYLCSPVLHTGCGHWTRFLPGMSLWTPGNAVDTTRLSPPLDNYRNPDNIYDTHHHCHPGHRRAVRSFSFIRNFFNVKKQTRYLAKVGVSICKILLQISWIEYFTIFW